MLLLNSLLVLNMLGCSLLDKLQGASDPDPYDIQIEYVGWTPTADQEDEMDAAAQMWETVILEGLASFSVNTTQEDIDANPLAEFCQPWDETVDDLLVWIMVDTELSEGMGAVGKVCHYDPGGTGLPRSGVVRLGVDLSVADPHEAPLAETVAHEIGHVILYTNRVWNLDVEGDTASARELIPGYEGECPEESEYVYEGAAGVAAWHAMGGEGDVPMEPGDSASPGAGCTHLKENVFQAALMTPYGDEDMPLGLTSVSVGMLQDGGYVADPDQAVEVEVNVTDAWMP